MAGRRALASKTGNEESHMPQIELQPVEKIRVTVLMDNVTDPLIPD
jgi:hypothetical protein